MAMLRMRKADAIVFQVLRRNIRATSDPQNRWEEYKVFPMTTKPGVVRYSYGSRSAITQTIPDEGFVDRFGSRLTTVDMSGSFGLQPRRQGLSLKDGYTRFLDFRDEVFKLSQEAKAKKPDEAAQYVYAVNYYDFIQDERFAINLETFIPELSARRNPIEPSYQLRFQSIGPTIQVETKDPNLFLLLQVDKAIDIAQDALEDAINALHEVPIVGTALDIGDGILSGIDILVGVSANIGHIGALYRNAISGQFSSQGSIVITDPLKNLIGAVKG